MKNTFRVPLWQRGMKGDFTIMFEKSLLTPSLPV
jgi:hypothetical protein